MNTRPTLFSAFSFPEVLIALLIFSTCILSIARLDTSGQRLLRAADDGIFTKILKNAYYELRAFPNKYKCENIDYQVLAKKVSQDGEMEIHGCKKKAGITEYKIIITYNEKQRAVHYALLDNVEYYNEIK